MTSDDQQFLDVLASVPQDIAAYGSRLADYIDRYTNTIASDIRDAIDNSTWIPEKIKPPKPQGGHFFARAPPAPQGYYEQTVTWVSKNRTAIAMVVAFVGTTAYLAHRSKKAHARKRRAKKLANGAKKEIVVLACSTFHDPLTRSLALDLERRGYVVYVTVSSTEEDSLIQQEAKADLRPLWMDLTSTVPNPTVDIHPNLEAIRDLLTQLPKETSGGRSSGGSSMGNMTLAGLVVFPGCSGYPSGSLPLLPPTEVIDTLNTRLLSPLLSIQQFLPLILNHSSATSPASIILAYPSIPASLSPPRQIPESIITSSLSSLSTSLRRELRTLSPHITVHDLKLGNFDLGSDPAGKSPAVTPRPSVQSNYPNLDPAQSQLIHTPWHSSQRAALTRSTLQRPSFIKGSSARELHNAVFDALAPPQSFRAFGRWDWTSPKTGGTVFVGSGARVYDFVGRWVPGGLVGAVMAFRDRRSSRGARGVGEWRAPSEVRREQQSVYDSRMSASATEGEGIGESAVWEKV